MATLVIPAAPRAKPRRGPTPEDKFGKAATSAAFWSLIAVMIVPAVSALLSILAIRRGIRFMDEKGQGVRCVGALGLGATTLIFSLFFWLLWGLLRPTPTALAQGWVGLRRLPAIPIGFQHTRDDPFAWSLRSFKMPAPKH